MRQVARNKKSEFSQHKSNWFDLDFFFRAACVTNKKRNHFSSITRLKIHHQLENHRKELFSTELCWEIFCCINSYDFNSKTRLGHVTSPESKMAERDVSISHYPDFVFLPSLLSSKLVLFFTEPKLNTSIRWRRSWE